MGVGGSPSPSKRGPGQVGTQGFRPGVGSRAPPPWDPDTWRCPRPSLLTPRRLPHPPSLPKFPHPCAKDNHQGLWWVGEKAHTRPRHTCTHTCTQPLDHCALRPTERPGLSQCPSPSMGGQWSVGWVPCILKKQSFLYIYIIREPVGRPSSVKTDQRGTGCISCSHHRPLLPWRQWKEGTRGGSELWLPGGTRWSFSLLVLKL